MKDQIANPAEVSVANLLEVGAGGGVTLTSPPIETQANDTQTDTIIEPEAEKPEPVNEEPIVPIEVRIIIEAQEDEPELVAAPVIDSIITEEEKNALEEKILKLRKKLK